MAGWVRCSGGRLIYSRITRAPFMAWTDTPRGQALVRSVAQHIRFSLLGKERAARGILWRELAAAIGNEHIITLIRTQVDAYLGRLGAPADAHRRARTR